MSSHADTIRRIRNQLPADVARDFDALLAENQPYEKALERINALRTTEGDALEDAVAIAREALAGDAE